MSKRREGETWKEYRAPNDRVSLEIPSEWTAEEQAEFGVLSAVGGAACIAVATFVRPRATLADFAEAKFRVEDYYRARTGRVTIRGAGWEGFEQTFEGHAPEDPTPTLCRISCMHGEELFVSVTLYTSPELYGESQELFDKIRSSLRIHTVDKPWWRFWGRKGASDGR